MKIIVLSKSDGIEREMAGYINAFRERGDAVTLVNPDCAPNGALHELLESCSDRPALLLHPESFSILPWGLTETDVLTACFQIDTYAYTRRRMSWSMLFDFVFVFHPGYDSKFRMAGHAGTHFIPHAVDAALFFGTEPERGFDVGWVGQTEGPLYHTRKRILPRLCERFRMNEFDKSYSPEEMARVYRQSKIVVNIGRDDFPQDANLRVFEAMAAGALLITALPTELTQIGFEEGIHFIGYEKESELVPLVQRYLSDEAARQRIAGTARELVLDEHTYNRRVETIVKLIEGQDGKYLAPARSWTEGRVHLTYLDYFAANGLFGCARKELRAIAHKEQFYVAKGVLLLVRAQLGRLRLWMTDRSWRRQVLGKMHRDHH